MAFETAVVSDEAYPIVTTKKSENEDRLLYVRTARDRRRCLVLQCLLLPPLMVAAKERRSSLHRLSRRLILLQSDLLLWHGPPPPFDQDVGECPPPTVHTHLHSG
jgi:hypothetical protein